MDEKPTLPAASDQGAAPAPDEDWSGRSLGDFVILRRLGKGGMGQVFLAEQISLKRKVALKILRPDLAASPTSLKRFRAEAENVARLTHANIVQIYAIGDHEGMPFMALEYVEGRNLRDFINRKGPPELPVSLSIMRQIASALARAGEHGFVHRDIKPENILLTRKGEVKVADFGLSRCFQETGEGLNLTQSGVAMGTPMYMSPEQVQGKPVDQRTDIYSFGVTCYHMLAGQPPFRGNTAFDVAIKHVADEPPPLASFRPDLPADLCALVHKMMAKKPEERYQNCRDILRDLARLRDHANVSGNEPVSAPNSATTRSGDGATVSSGVTATVYPLSDTRPRASRWFLRILVAVILVGVLAGGIGVRLLKNRLFPPAADHVQAAPSTVQPFVTNEERLAREQADFKADPDVRDMSSIERGMNAQIDLAAYYFKKNRIDDAEKLFKSLAERNYHDKPPDASEHPYRILGRFGLALVLAWRDKAKESLDQLTRMIAPMQPIPNGLHLQGIPVPVNNLELRRLLAEALNRDAKNLKKDKLDPPYLENLRKPPAYIDPKRPTGKKDKDKP
ncbi:MAG TPA: serine/threonine-protein kinase [Gemmataceae bacterium]|jgi:serine/threonine-protein kinase|nr:serine/threonine-protein kinase [Gemmataceae bacterium]